ncbi:MAG: lytic transglycosylase domain-containing protein [Myxococcaceae bacterium]
MDRAEELFNPVSLVETTEAPHRTKARGRLGPWLVAMLGVQVLLLAAMVGAGVFATSRLAELRAASDAHARAAEESAAKLDGLAASSALMGQELSSLRQAVASKSREDVVFLKALILKPGIEPGLARRIAASVRRYSELYGRDPNLALAIIAVESDFNPKAISSVGAVGLMQVMPHWKKVLGITDDLENPDVSIRSGLQILGFYQEMYRDMEMALTAYNRGPGPVDGALMRGTSPKNGYAAKVLETYERLKSLDSTPSP